MWSCVITLHILPSTGEAKLLQQDLYNFPALNSNQTSFPIKKKKDLHLYSPRKNRPSLTIPHVPLSCSVNAVFVGWPHVFIIVCFFECFIVMFSSSRLLSSAHVDALHNIYMSSVFVLKLMWQVFVFLLIQPFPLCKCLPSKNSFQFRLNKT